MAKEKEYLSPTDNNPLLRIEREGQDLVYRDSSTGEEYTKEYVEANFKTRDETFPPEDEGKKPKRTSKKPATDDGPSGPAADEAEDEEQEEDEDEDEGASGPEA